MNRTCFMAAAAVVLWTLTPGAASAKANTTAARAEVTLEEIGTRSADVAAIMDELSGESAQQLSRDSHAAGLDSVKEMINKIGRDLQTLDAERDSLAPWEVNALSQVLPLMRDAADHVSNAIKMLSSEPGHLWGTSYSSDLSSARDDARKAEALIRDYVKLQGTQAKELRLEHELGASGQF